MVWHDIEKFPISNPNFVNTFHHKMFHGKHIHMYQIYSKSTYDMFFGAGYQSSYIARL